MICKCGCGQEFVRTNKNQLFISSAHKSEYYSSIQLRKRNGDSLIGICKKCGKEFMRQYTREYCSVQCRYDQHRYIKRQNDNYRKKEERDNLKKIRDVHDKLFETRQPCKISDLILDQIEKLRKDMTKLTDSLDQVIFIQQILYLENKYDEVKKSENII